MMIFFKAVVFVLLFFFFDSVLEAVEFKSMESVAFSFGEGVLRASAGEWHPHSITAVLLVTNPVLQEKLSFCQ